jgi:2-polyprenyl-3-methyl-5-hydroxy-6-metoxy-1,4-benzoquinol methylase
MTKNYYKYTKYTRHVDFKRLDCIVRSIRDRFNNRTDLKGLDLGCGKGNVTVPLAYLRYQMTGVLYNRGNQNHEKTKIRGIH